MLIFSLRLVTALYGQDALRAAGEAVNNLHLYPGLQATLFASEPLIASPTNIDVDDRGRVWVCEVQNYRGHGARDQRPAGDRILILEDTDGDGTADLTKVFYQGRDVDAALGICVFDGTVVVTCAPNVILFRDDDGDDRPDSKSYLFTDTGRPQNDHSTHSFVFGPDGHFYWNMGNGGAFVHDRDGRPVYDSFGRRVFDRRLSQGPGRYENLDGAFWGGMVFRCDLDGGEFEVLGHNFRNNYEVTVDSYGNPWQSDNDDDGNYGVRLNFIMELGNYGYLDELTGASWRVPRVGEHADISSRHWHQNDPGVVPNYVQTGAGSPTGITVYEGELLPERFWGKVLHCDAGPGVLWAAEGGAEGAGFSAAMVPLVQSPNDKWFRPVDVAVAPDGSLFLSDWYDPVVGWNRQADLARGRIFRIAPEEHGYRPPEFDFDTAEGAIEALKSPAYSVRARAWLALNEMGPQAVGVLKGLAKESNPRYRARAYWLLAALPQGGNDYIQKAIRDSDPNIRLVGLRAALRYEHPLLPAIDRLVEDSSSAVRRECAVMLRRLSGSLIPERWARLAGQFDGEDRWYLEALGIGAEGHWDECLNALLQPGDRDLPNKALRRILWRSRSVSTPRHLTRMLGNERLPEEEIPGLLRAFDFQPESEEKAAQLLALLEPQNLAGGPESRDLIRYESLIRLADLSVAAGASIDAQARRLVGEISDPKLKLELIRRFQLKDRQDEVAGMVRTTQGEGLASAAAAVLFELGAGDLLAGMLASSSSASARIVEAVAATRHRDAVPVLLRVVQDVDYPQAVREAALRGMIEGGHGGGLVLDLAQAGEFPMTLAAVAGASFSKTLHVMQRNAAASLFPVTGLRDDHPLPGMTELLVYRGDVERGRQVFQSATCAQCHQVNGKGTSYGPDLSGIGAKLAKRGLYESILDPSASVSPSYRGVEVELGNGDSLTGLLVSETEEELVINLQGVGLRTLARADVEESRALNQSVMPAGLQQLMTFDDLVDLVEYLSVQRQ